MSTRGASSCCAGALTDEEQRPEKGEALLQGSWMAGRQVMLSWKRLRGRPWGWKFAMVMYLQYDCSTSGVQYHGGRS
jgi:hypothetical protein